MSLRRLVAAILSGMILVMVCLVALLVDDTSPPRAGGRAYGPGMSSDMAASIIELGAQVYCPQHAYLFDEEREGES